MRAGPLLAVIVLALATPAVVPSGASAESGAATAAERGAPVDELSAAKRKKTRSSRSARAAHAYGAYRGTQIACTRFGCHPIPRRCGITTEYNFWTLDPTGFDAVVCR
jgi:hypothetical protein